MRRPAFDLFGGTFRIPDSAASSAIGYTTASWRDYMLRGPAKESPSPADLSFRAIPHPPNRPGRLTLKSGRRSIAQSFSIIFVHWAFSAVPGWRQTVTAEFQSPHIFNCPDDLPRRGSNTKL